LMTPTAAVCRISPLPLCHGPPTPSAISRPSFFDDDDGDEGAAFRLLISELEEWCGFNTSAAVSARDQAAVASDSVTEAAVPGVDRLERTEFSPRVEQEGHMGEQRIAMASDIAVDRLAAISSVGDASRGAVVEATLRVADEHVPVKEAPMVVVDAALSMVVKISERCEAVPACMESMGLLVEVIGMMLSPDVSGTVVDRYMGALALLANMAVKIIVSGSSSDPTKMGCLVHSGFDPPMLRCC
jgi:hypothetical protein